MADTKKEIKNWEDWEMDVRHDAGQQEKTIRETHANNALQMHKALYGLYDGVKSSAAVLQNEIVFQMNPEGWFATNRIVEEFRGKKHGEEKVISQLKGKLEV